MGYQEICEGLVNDTDGALGCLVINLDTGLTLAAAQRHDTPLHEGEINAAFRSSEDMFRGRFIEQYVQALPTKRKSAIGFVREVQITTPFSHQFLVAIPGLDEAVLVLITERTLSLGHGWMAVHRAQQLFADAPKGKAPDSGQAATESTPEPIQQADEDARAEARHRPPARTTAPPQAYERPRAHPLPEPTARLWDTASPVRPPKRMPIPSVEPEQKHSPPPETPIPDSAEPPRNPLVARKQGATPADAPASTTETDPQQDVEPQFVAGPRAKMFKPRTSGGKKK